MALLCVCGTVFVTVTARAVHNAAGVNAAGVGAV
jgi:hypothetical protein